MQGASWAKPRRFRVSPGIIKAQPVPGSCSIVPDFDPILPPKRLRASFQTTNLRGDL
jgi:hypothetical protein